jgi:hypothetical protein
VCTHSLPCLSPLLCVNTFVALLTFCISIFISGLCALWDAACSGLFALVFYTLFELSPSLNCSSSLSGHMPPSSPSFWILLSMVCSWLHYFGGSTKMPSFPQVNSLWLPFPSQNFSEYSILRSHFVHQLSFSLLHCFIVVGSCVSSCLSMIIVYYDGFSQNFCEYLGTFLLLTSQHSFLLDCFIVVRPSLVVLYPFMIIVYYDDWSHSFDVFSIDCLLLALQLSFSMLDCFIVVRYLLLIPLLFVCPYYGCTLPQNFSEYSNIFLPLAPQLSFFCFTALSLWDHPLVVFCLSIIIYYDGWMAPLSPLLPKK